jgi:hypothetical protein
MVVGGAKAGDRGASSLLSHPVPRFIGRISYSWYLWHWPCLVIANTRWPAEEATPTGATHASARVTAAAVLVSFLLAVASHYAVEQPLRAASFLRASRRRSLRLGGILVVTSVVVACGLGIGSRSAADQPIVASATAPGPLTPEAARADKPDNSGPCYPGYAATEVPALDQCRVGPASGGSKTIALVGDSHAQQWLPALRKAAEQLGWTVYHYAKPSCTVTDVPIWHVQAKGRYRACEQWRTNLLDRIGQIEGLDAVIVGRWSDYREIALEPNGSRATPDNIAELWFEGSKRTYPVMAEAAPRIIVVADTPRPTKDVPSCLSATEDPAACAFDRRSTTRQDEVLFQAEKSAAPGAVRSVDLTSVLCPDRACPVVSPQGQIMYRDANHLTDGYSGTLWKPFSDAVITALK